VGLLDIDVWPRPSSQHLDTAGNSSAEKNRFQAVQPQILHPVLIVNPSNDIETESGANRAGYAEQPESGRRLSQESILLSGRVLQYPGDVPIERSDGHGARCEPAQNESVAAREEGRSVRDGVPYLTVRCSGQRKTKQQDTGTFSLATRDYASVVSHLGCSSFKQTRIP
jgi:hypothetical protein